MSEPIAWVRGEFVPYSSAVLPIYDLGVVLGATVTEQCRTFHRQVYRLDDHLARLDWSLNYAGIHPGLLLRELGAIGRQVVDHNALLLPPGGELGLILFITAGESIRYSGGTARPGATVCVHTFPLPLTDWSGAMRDGFRLATPSIRNLPPECVSARLKCRSRMHFFLAEQEVRQSDPLAVPLLLSLEGFVTETSTANVLLVQGDELISPPEERILPGVSRQTAIELAPSVGLHFQTRDLTVSDVLGADELLLTSTPYCVLPATQLDGSPIGSGRPGPAFARLQAAWSRAVGLDIAAQIRGDASPDQ